MDKILRTLESIKVPTLTLQYNNESSIPGQLQSAVVAAGDSVKTKKKERISHCLAVSDAVCSSSVQSLADYPKLLESVSEVLFLLCNDPDSDIRLVATDCLHRIVRTLKDQLLHRFQMEIYKEIKRNQSPRSLRTALNLFAFMSPYIRPQKCRAFMQSLFPCFSQISKRHEELLYENLPGSLTKIFESLGTFLSEEEIKVLCNDFLHNLNSKSTIIRRSSAAILVAICQYSRRPHVLLPKLLQLLTDLLTPDTMQRNTSTIIGALICVRRCIPPIYDYLSNDYPATYDLDHNFVLSNLTKIYETLMLLCNHDDHNVITTTLETLITLFTSPPDQIAVKFLYRFGLHAGSTVEGNTSGSRNREAKSTLFLESSSISLEGDSDIPSFAFEHPNSTSIDEPQEDFDIEASISSSERNSDIFIMANTSEPEMENGEIVVPIFDDDSEITTKSSRIIENIPELFIGSLFDVDIPLNYCSRFIASNFLLTGREGQLRQESESRVSVKVLAINCLNQMILITPGIYCIPLRKLHGSGSSPAEHEQYMHDVSLFMAHPDPLLRGSTYTLIGNMINSVLRCCHGKFKFDFHQAVGTWKRYDLSILVSELKKGLSDTSNIVVRCAIGAVSCCLEMLWRSENGAHYAEDLLAGLLDCLDNSYWLVKVDLAEAFGAMKWDMVVNRKNTQHTILDILIDMLRDEDARVRGATVSALLRFIDNCGQSRNRNSGSFHMLCEKCVLNTVYESTKKCSASHLLNEELSLWLEIVVNQMIPLIVGLENKNDIAGYYAALTAICEKYPPEVYKTVWRCQSNEVEIPFLFGLTIDYVRTSGVVTDLLVHQNLLTVSTKLFVGSITSTNSKEAHDEVVFVNSCGKQLSEYGMQLLYHSITILKMYHTTMRSSADIGHSKKAPISPLSSPGKKSFKVDGDKKPFETDSVKKGENDFFQYNFSTGLALCSSHFEKISEAIYQSWKIYKSNLDSNAEHKFTSLLVAALKTLGEVCSHLKSDYRNLPNLIEDVLDMTSTIFHICPIATLQCIRKMLQCLFSTKTDVYLGEEEVLCEDKELNLASFIAFWHNYQLKPKGYKKSVSDVKLLGTYIRPFEPVVITGLKMYTTSNDVFIQAEVLSLLSELIKGHVNYAHVDSNQIFLGFVIKQISFLQEGHIRNPDVVISKIFEFLVLLSKEETRTKKFIDMEKILNLCQTLLASGRHPPSYCIPALRPVISNLFLEPVKTGLPAAELSNLESQRDLAFSLLVKLTDYSEALPLILAVILSRKAYAGSKFLNGCEVLAKQLLESIAKERLVPQGFAQYECLLAVLFGINTWMYPPSQELMKDMRKSMRIGYTESNDVDIREFSVWCATVTSRSLVLIRQYKHGEAVYFPLQFITQLLVKLIEDFKASLFPRTSCPLVDLSTKMVVVFLHTVRIYLNLEDNKRYKKVMITCSRDVFHAIGRTLVELSIIHPVLRKELTSLLCDLENTDELLWSIAFNSWSSEQIRFEFLIYTTIPLLKRLEKKSNQCLTKYLLNNAPLVIAWLSYSKHISNFLKSLTVDQTKILFSQFHHVFSIYDPFLLQQTAIRNIMQIISNLRIPFKKESVILCLKFIEWSSISYLSFQAAQNACSTFKQIQAEDLKFDKEELKTIKSFLSVNNNSLNFPRLVSLAKRSIATCEDRKEVLMFEPDELHNFTDNPIHSWCCAEVSWSEGPALVRMLGGLPITAILDIFNDDLFNLAVLPHSFRFIQNLLLQNTMSLSDAVQLITLEKRADLINKWPLGVASFDYITKLEDRLDDLIPEELMDNLEADAAAMDDLEAIITQENLQRLWSSLSEILRLKSTVVKLCSSEGYQFLHNFVPLKIFTFSFLFMRVQITRLNCVSISMIQEFLEFAAIVLEDSNFFEIFNICIRGHAARIFCCIFSLDIILKKIRVQYNTTYVCSKCDEPWSEMNDFCVEALRVFHHLTDFISQVRRGQIWMEPNLLKSLMRVVQGLARCDLVNSWVLISHMGWKPQVLTKTDVFPPIKHIPLEILQNEKDLLLKYVFKLNMFGIASKLQFEENWMNFLTVINSYVGEHFHCQIIIVGLRALTMMLEHSVKVNYITDVLVRRFVDGLAHVDLAIAEFEPEMCRKFKLPQLTSEHTKVFENKFNIDLNSCVRFLIDLFTQWLQNSQNKLPLILLTEVVETIINISKYFEETQNYTWMMDTFINLFRGLDKEDEVVWSHLIYGTFLAASDLPTLDSEIMNSLLLFLQESLISPFVNVTNVAFKSALVYLQAHPNCRAIINVVSPFLLKNTELRRSDSMSEAQNYSTWELLLFIWAHGPASEEETDEFEKDLVGNIFSALSPLNNCLVSIRLSILKCLKHMVEEGLLKPEIKRKITRLSIDVLKTPNMAIFFDTLKLYLSIFYVDFKGMYDTPHPEAETMMLVGERCEVLYQILKSGKRFNSLVTSKVLPLIVRDFLPPLDVLNRMIAEFLSPQQNSPELVAPILSQVFEKARRRQEVSLVRAWIIESLQNFFSSTDIDRTIWSLTFFFVGISTIPSVYNLLPFAELKIHSLQTRKLFVHAALDFYASLDENEKAKFLTLLQKGPFLDNELSPYNFLLDLMSGLPQSKS